MHVGVGDSSRHHVCHGGGLTILLCAAAIVLFVPGLLSAILPAVSSDGPTISFTSSQASSPPTSSSLRNYTNNTAQQDYYQIHQDLYKQTREQWSTIEQQFGSRFVSMDYTQNDHIPSDEEVAKQLEKLLMHSTLILMGDSTIRHLYGYFWCLLEGYSFQDESDNDTLAEKRTCQQVQDVLKAKCSASTSGNPNECATVATFSSHKHKDFRLYFQPDFMLQPLTNITQESIRKRTLPGETVLFLGMPCLHSLWSPGNRERFVLSNDTDIGSRFESLFTTLGQSLPQLQSHQQVRVSIGTTVALCDAKLGPEQNLVQAYLRQENISLVATSDPVYRQYQGDQIAKASLNLTNIVPRQDYRRNHQHDFALFDEVGAYACSLTALKVLWSLTQHDTDSRSSKMNPRSSMMKQWNVVDMHQATQDGCDDTDDGRHYNGGTRTIRKQAAALFKSISLQQEEDRHS